MNAIDHYISLFNRLKRATLRSYKAPHKPVLLISIIQAIASGEISENKIEITPQLVARFRDNWNWLVKDDKFKPNFSLPFYHLSNEKFWHLQTYPGMELILTSSHSIKSLAQLNETIAFAWLDAELYELLIHPASREILYTFLLEKYFPERELQKTPEYLITEITDQILHASGNSYQKQIEFSDEEEIWVRGGVFKRLIPKYYGYSCCITGMQILSSLDVQMVDACHIIPFSVSHDDTIGNGISLSPNLHRAFDRGLVTIDDDYRVRLSTKFVDKSPDGGLQSLEGKLIHLPQNTEYYPALENLRRHRKEWFKN